MNFSPLGFILFLVASTTHACKGPYCAVDECPPPPPCAAPPDGCFYEGPVLDDNGCLMGCGMLRCECPLFKCAAPPTGCFYGQAEINEFGCAMGCGKLICPLVCSKEAKACYDGSTTGRDPNNNCEFFPCPPPTCSNCPFGFFDGCNDCTCLSTAKGPICTTLACLVEGEPQCHPPPVGCTDDVLLCPDGVTYVGRNPNNNCKFDKCPERLCSGFLRKWYCP
jgi:hypothetical protein